MAKITESYRSILSFPDLRRRLLVVAVAFVIYAFGVHIPLPGVDRTALASLFQAGGGLFGLVNLFSGGALEQFSVLSLGVIPYINASIMMQLLAFSVDSFRELIRERGEEGRRILARYTRYITIAVAILQSIGLLKMFSSQGILTSSGWFYYLFIILSLTGGTCFLMWLGEEISNRGIGEGISLLIFASIVLRLPTSIGREIASIRANPGAFGNFLGYVGLLLLLLVFIVFVELSERRIPVRYARRQVGRLVYGGQSSYLPIKVNLGGVIPIIFAITFMLVPSTLATYMPKTWPGFHRWQQSFPGTYYYYLVLAFLILLSNHFYSAVIFKPDEIADNLKNYGGFIPGVRPGEQTAEYIARIQEKITWMGGFFLAGVGVLPFLLGKFFGVQNFLLSGTGLLIAVGVALDTVRQLEAHIVTRQYEGFIK